MKEGEPNLAYIGSRFYRSPEQILDSVFYGCGVDVWAMGCVSAELWLGTPLFQGSSNLEQMVHIIRVLGAPAENDVKDMKVTSKYAVFPEVKPIRLERLFKYYKLEVPQQAIDLMEKFLIYSPKRRISAFAVLAHPYFDDLRREGARLPNGKPFPPLFNFTNVEEREARKLGIWDTIVPSWYDPSKETP